MSTSDSSDSDGIWHTINRRATLKAIAAAIGVAGLTGEAAAGPGNRKGNRNGGGSPGASDCDLHVDKDDSDNYDSIQAAVDDAGPGDTICVAPEGTYYENVLVQTENLTLQQQGNGNAPNPTVNPKDQSVQPIRIEADGVTVDGIDVTGGYKGLVASTGNVSDPLEGITVENLDAYGNANDGTTFWRVKDSLVENVEAYDNGDNGIYANGPNNTVRNSVAYDNSDQGIDMSNDYDEDGGTDQNWGGATVEDCTAFENHNGGIELDDDEGDATLKRNHTYDNDFSSRNPGDPTPSATGLVLNGTSSVETVVGNDFEDGIAVDGVDTDP